MSNCLRRYRPSFETLEAREVLTNYVGVELRATDLAGNQITAITEGQAFNLQIYVDDLRYIADPPSNYIDEEETPFKSIPLGVASAVFDIEYDGEAFDFTGPSGLLQGPGSPTLETPTYNAQKSVDGYLEEIGTFQISTADGSGVPRLWLTIPMVAENTLGEFTISAMHPLSNEFFPDTKQGGIDEYKFNSLNPTANLEGGGFLDPDEIDYTEATITLEVVEAGLPVDVEMRIVKQPTTVDSNGEVVTLPDNAEWIDEWDSFYVEIYARAPETGSVKSVSVVIDYTNEYHNASSFTSNSDLKFTPSNTVYASYADRVSATFSTPLSGLGNDGKSVLVGRILFGPDQSLGNGVANTPASDYADPVVTDFTLVGGGATVQYGGGYETTGVSGVNVPSTELFAVPYDLDDDRTISIVDLTYIIRNIGKAATPANQLYRMDFTHDGYVDLVDLALMVRNIGTTVFNARDRARSYFDGFPYFDSGASLMEGESVGVSGFVLEGESVDVEDEMLADSPISTPAPTYMPLFVPGPTASTATTSQPTPEEESATTDSEIASSVTVSEGNLETMLIVAAAEEALSEESPESSEKIDEAFAEFSVDDPHLTM
ncbi:dockerin type I domain-containing protein [Blastopirellula retiformator]|uniref:Dockerin type I repeat protein n=1 Tax=Blastopirellula retiformator TaxID=2527970 RepID=A0A5C5UYW8_9BACT|nr:dockerin type I domain-containing protein [Blastopirellula retiformator]TWT31431.1 hypothetical protein Enr8_33520 [Blastopirellula retiformator]